jgi:alpha-ribazole phosphatase
MCAVQSKLNPPEMKNGIHGSVNGPWIFFKAFMARKLLLLRHGDVGDEYHDRYIGSTNVSLSERGHQQVRTISAWLRSQSIDCCYCSPLKRCKETAAIVLDRSSVEYKVDPDLREIDFGRWEGLSFADIVQEFPDEVKRWSDFDMDFAFPDGERIGDCVKRIVGIADRLAEDPADTVLVCTHGGIIRLLICYFLGLEPWQYILFRVERASVTTIALFDGAGLLCGLNETGEAVEEAEG